jgi:hypothetical protein
VPYADFSDPQSLNQYAYVRNNPLSRADADGHDQAPKFAPSVSWDDLCRTGIGCTTEQQKEILVAHEDRNQAEDPAQDAKKQGSDAAQVQQLTNAQDAAMNDPNLQPGAHHAASHCSEATCQIAGAVGADTSPLVPSGGGFYSANTQVANLDKVATTPGSGWQKSDLGSAQGNANQGKLVIIGWANPKKGASGHTVTVRPDLNNKHGKTNPTVAQVGGSTGNGVMPFRNAFGADKRGAVQVYVYIGN